AAACVQAKGGLESYIYSLHNSTTNEKLTDKFESTDKSKLDSCINKTISAFTATSVDVECVVYHDRFTARHLS
ncbi:hypothetical protein EV702DRAFT_966633, partial [Suillus placidus]